MSAPPNRRLHEDGGNDSVSGNYSYPAISKYQHDDQGAYSGAGGKVVTSTRHEYHHTPYDIGQEGRMPKIASRNEPRDVDRRSPLLPNMLFRVSTPSDSNIDHVGSDAGMDFRDSKDSTKEIKVENRNLKSESRELHQMAKSDKYDIRADGSKYSRHERDTYSVLKVNENLDKDGYTGSGGQLNWKDMKEQHRVKQYPDIPGGKAEIWHTSHTGMHGPSDATKEGLHVDDRNIAEAREAVGENRVDMKGEEKFKDKDRKRKEVKHWDWGEKGKEGSDRSNNLQLSNSASENKEVVREEGETERWGSGKKEPSKEKANPVEKAKDHLKRELWNGMDKEIPQNEKELIAIAKKPTEHEHSTPDPKKKDHDTCKNVDRDARDRKKERDTDIEPERPDKRNKHQEKESDVGGINLECGTEQEREGLSQGVQQRKRMLRPRGSPQIGNQGLGYQSCANDNEGSQGKADMYCVVYKIGECMQELINLWREHGPQPEKASGGSQNGPTLEIRIPAEHVTATNHQVKGGQLWGTDIYTVDSDLVAVLMHTGYCRPTASPPPSSTQELRATIRVLPPQDCYISTLRNNVRSRAWGAAIGCSYRVEQCCIVKKGGGIIELEPCLTHSSTMEPTLAPVAVERTMTTRAAASNALRQQRFVREVTVQFNLCMEPWLKYSASVVADKGLKKSLYTSARLKKGEVLYVETHFNRYELSFNGEKVIKPATTPHANGAETGRAQAYHSHASSGEKSAADGESTVVDVFRWSRCKRPLPQKTMQSVGIPLPLQHIKVLEDNLEWDDISWSTTGAWIAGKEYHLARAHFILPN